MIKADLCLGHKLALIRRWPQGLAVIFSHRQVYVKNITASPCGPGNRHPPCRS
jgi:hypothetical protein